MDIYNIREELIKQQENGIKFPNNHFLNFTPDHLMEIQKINSLFPYSKLFVSKLYYLSVTGDLHLPSLTQDLISLSQNKKTKMKPPSPLSHKKLKKYKLSHMHFYYNIGLIKNYSNALKKPEIKKHLPLISPHQDTEQFKKNFNLFWEELNKIIKDKEHLTGEWIIFKEYNNNKYFLDIVAHNSDDYLIEAVESYYTSEFPEIFQAV